MPFLRGFLVVVSIFAFITGCAGVDYKPAPATIAPRQDAGGIVYYEDSPYLLVYPDGKGNISWQVLFLPDQTKKRIAVPYNFISSLNTSLTFQNGLLTQSSTTADATAVLKTVAAAIQALGTKAFLLAPLGPKPPPAVPSAKAQIFLYKITVRNNKVTFSGANDGHPVTVVVPMGQTPT